MVSGALMKYSSGYKYQLEEDYEVQTPVKGTFVVGSQFILYGSGLLHISRGFAWDGASGPTFDSKSSMIASLVHDVFCVMMRNKMLPYTEYHHTVNKFFRQQCIDAGMWKWRAEVWYRAVELADAGNPDQGPDRVVIEV
jgi:hypothetical protein